MGLFDWLRGREAVSPPTAQPIEEQAAVEAAESKPRATHAFRELGRNLFGQLTSRRFDPSLWREWEETLEETLLKADVGVDTTMAVLQALEAQKPQIQTANDFRIALEGILRQLLTKVSPRIPLAYNPGGLNIVVLVGVNGSGKTTTLGKLAHHYRQEGQPVVIGAGDTYRAAAVDQLRVWAERAGAEFVEGGGDPAAVAYQAIHRATETFPGGRGVVLLDTAGRLQNQQNLMAELGKVHRIVERERPDTATIERLLVVDAVTGQNALSQARHFHAAMPLTGAVVTKLDTTAKGGVIFSLAREFELPVKLVGVGERIADLRPFEPDHFVDSIFESFEAQVRV